MPRTHLTVLEQAVSRDPSTTLFKVPVIDIVTGKVTNYEPISVGQFAQDVDAAAKYWAHVLKRDGIPTKSVIGICLGGVQYIDAVNLYSVTRAGYIPHSFSGGLLPGAAVVKGLLQKSNARAFIRYSDVKEVLKDIQEIPVYDSVTSIDDIAIYGESCLSPMSEMNENDIAIIFNTSGSVSGSPKLVTGTYRWLDGLVHKHGGSFIFSRSRSGIVNWMASVCHVGQFGALVYAIQSGSCVVQMKNCIDEKEILAAIDLASLTGISLFSPFLVKMLALSKADRDVLSSLVSLNSIISSGAALPRAEEEYARQHNINIVNVFGMTEPGGVMATSQGTRMDPSNAFRPMNIPGLSYQFVPVASSGEDPHSYLLELVILPDSIDCPDAEFLDPADGCFHTGDLWRQVENGYIYCGRNDDWIMCPARCDTRAIEDNVRQTCSDLVSDCIAVGNLRPSPVIFIESKTNSSDEDVKKSIFKRIEPFHSQRMVHERIKSSDMIVVVAPNTLPRTAKGNIRRRAVEDAYKEVLDQIYNN
uniref:AMP-dependent synthetase/ligase domain-containing protein n=2 Tax=Moniliophthora roreri TaxID=221103 RepID=A0A0W0FFG0_MONRR